MRKEEDDSVGLLFHPLWWIGLILFIVIVLNDNLSIPCIIAGILMGSALTECVIRAKSP